MNDPVVDEVRTIRDAHAARFNYDLHAIFHDIKRREKSRGLHFVNGVAHLPAPISSPQPTEPIATVAEAAPTTDL